MALSNYPKVVTDQLQRSIVLNAPPKRIISLVPSQTELLFDLGLEDEVIGITKFCIHPEKWLKTKVRIGGTKKYNFEKINALNPDLIIGNKEENDEQAIKQLMDLYTVWMSDIKTLADALQMIESIGALVDKQARANTISKQLRTDFETLAEKVLPEQGKATAYFIWKNPYMVAGHSTFINEMLCYCNLKNIFINQQSRYPVITTEDLMAAKPEILLLSSEPYPFEEKHINEFKEILPGAKIIIVDGELFSWYGSRLLHTPAYLNELYTRITV